MRDVNTILRTITSWRYLIKTELTQAFYHDHIPLSQSSLKYCGVATPFRRIRVYTRSAMGMPGSETAIKEMMCRVLVDDLYCGGDLPETLLSNWRRVLGSLDNRNLRLSPTKTIICPKSTTILCWIWSQGTLSASPHRFVVLSSCLPPLSVKGLRSFIGAYKVLGRVLPNCSDVVDPLEYDIIPVVPRFVLDGLLTSLLIKLNHPSRHQFQMVLQRQFFALDVNNAIFRVTSACHTCASLLSFPPLLSPSLLTTPLKL